MATNLFKTTTKPASPLDASGGTGNKPTVSDFVTIQSLTNFTVMTGAITTAWNALQQVEPAASSRFVPLGLCLLFGLVSVLISIDGLKKEGHSKLEIGTLLGAILVAVLNALVLTGAVIGAAVTTNPSTAG